MRVFEMFAGKNQYLIYIVIIMHSGREIVFFVEGLEFLTFIDLVCFRLFASVPICSLGALEMKGHHPSRKLQIDRFLRNELSSIYFDLVTH